MKAKNTANATAFLLAAVMLLSGCSAGNHFPENENTGRPGPDSTQPIEIGTDMISEDGTWKGLGGCYKLSDPGLEDSARDVLIHGNELYHTSLEFIDEDVVMYVKHGGDIMYQAGDIREAATGDSGIWILEDVTDYTVSTRHEFELLQIGYDKQELFRQNISQYMEDSFPNDMLTDQEGRVFLLLENSVIVFSPEGSYLSSIPLGTSYGTLITGGDGQVYAAAGKSSGSSGGFAGAGNNSILLRLDTAGKTAEAIAEYEGCQVCNGGGEYLITFVNDDGLYGVTSAGSEPVPIALWAELGLSFNRLRSIQWMTEDRFLLRDSSMFAVLEPTDPASVKPKTVLTMCSVSPWSTFADVVTDFNLQSEDYTVRIIDYTRNNEVSTEDAITALNLDIMAGKYPDLFDFSGLPEIYYAEKGLTEDIYTYIDQDPDLSRDTFILLDKIQTGDKLWSIPSTYSLESAAGLRSRFGDRTGWSLDEYLELQDTYSGDMMYAVTKEGFLYTFVHRYAAQAVDWDAGTCDFNNADFIKILNSISMLRENPEPSNSADLNYTPAGKRLSEGSMMLSIWYVDSVNTLAQARGEAGEPLTFIGLPTPDGSSGTQLYANNMMGICSKGSRDGAWSFIKYVLTEGTKKSSYGISVSRQIFESQIAQALEGAGEEDGVPVTQEDADQFRKLLDNSVYYGTASKKVVNIIMEETAPFLAGDRTAEDTARIIQSRVGILAAE